MNIKAEDFLKFSGAKGVIGNCRGLIFSGVSTDSREIKEGELFIALVGKIFDGHNFIADAINKGAWGIVIQKEKKDISLSQVREAIPVFIVDDTLKALQNLGSGMIQNMKAKRIAITGTVGKTECKDLTFHILNKMGFKTSRTKGNFNNYVGLPISILLFNGDEEFVVIEMGMNAKGEISLLSDIVKPHCGVITTIGEAHLEKIGTIKDIADAKAELYEKLGEDSFAVVNYNNQWCIEISKRTKARLIKFGYGQECDVRIIEKGVNAEGKSQGVFLYNNRVEKVEMPLFGEHHILNVGSALCACYAFGIFPENLTEILKDFHPPLRRTKVFEFDGITIIDDTYNASPLSMKSAIELLIALGQKKRKIAVLGDMLELGEFGPSLHFEIGKFLKEKGVDIVFAAGNNAKFYIDGALFAGIKEEKLIFCEDVIEIAEILSERIKEKDVILVKGSRGMQMERVIDFILKKGF